MKLILGFKNLEEEEMENCPLGDTLRSQMQEFHEGLMSKVSLEGVIENEAEEVS